MNITIEFFIFEWVYQISAETDNFHFLDQTFPRRVFLAYNRCKEHHHWVLHIRINLSSKFFPEQINLNFWTKYAQKRYLGPKAQKSEHRYWILYIRISPGPKFQNKLTILISWTKFAQKWFSSLKQIKWIMSLNSAYSN